MEIVNSIAAKISGTAIDAIVDQLGYLVHYNRNIKDFQQQAKDLELAIARVNGLIVEAEKQGETIQPYVLTHLTEVDKITEDIKHKNFPNVSCFNLFQRYRSSREAKKMRDELAAFEKKLEKLGKVGYRGPLPWMDSVFGYQSFESRDLIINNIVDALDDPDINIIGVYGMGGTGKTMLVKQIACQVSNSKLFEHVIMAVVGQNPQVRNIQAQLADKLRFEFKEETEQGRADSLRNRLLKEDKKILIIIDDVWNGLDFETVGIPIPSTHNLKGSKIIVTSRSHDILSNEMRIENKFKVGDLTEVESWNLFKDMVGESFESDKRRKEIAIKIANKCGKLPLALVLVAKALKGKPLPTWQNALRQLNNPASVEVDGVSKEVFASLNMSYGHLKSREVQSLFLLCSMYPDDYEIDTSELLTYAVGFKFLQGVDTLGETRAKILTMVHDLESACFLQKIENEDNDPLCVKMHDVIRDFAIHIASKDDQVCTLSYGKGLNHWQDEKLRGNYTAIQVDCEDFEDLPLQLSFPKLELLALLNNKFPMDNMLQIPEGYFGIMGKLKVLHLKGMCFSLPSSSDCLVHLRTLLLINCHVVNIDMIGKLKELEILDFSESNITELPLSLSQLSRLKQLKVSECQELEVIQPGVISRMSKLEELFLDDTFNDWGVGEFNNCEQKKAKTRISELGCLPFLTCLYLCIPDVRSLPEIEFLNNLKLDRFQIVIGKTKWDYSYFDSDKMLDIKTDSINDVWKELQLLERCEDLRLEGTCGVRNVVSKLKTSVHLKYLRLKDNEEVEYLVSELDDPNHDAFSILENLVLWKMMRLETIIIINEGYSFKTFKVFEKLKNLYISNCDKMKYLFSVSIIEGLSNLESIEIHDCKMMEAIVVVIENEAPVGNKMEFRRLRDLELRSLRKLKSFCGKLQKAKGLIESKSNEIVEVKEEEDRANSITPFYCQITFPPNLESLSIGVKNVWHDLLIGNNIKKLSLNRCKEIESVFTVKNNETSEDVFRWMPKLESLNLCNLRNLKHVWNKDIPYGILITFQSLRRVSLGNCPRLTTLFPHSLAKHLQQLQKISIIRCGIDEIFGKEESDSNSKVSLPSLDSLEIENVNNLEIIWHNRLVVDDMSNLRYVKLDKCKSLKSIFTSNVMSALKRLDELHIRNCDSLEQVFEIHQMIEPKEHREVASINLRKLVLHNLPSLKHVWSNDPFNEMYQFQDLNDVEVIKCPKLITIFPPSIARDLPHQLQCLHADFMDVTFMKQEPSSAKLNSVMDVFIGLKEMELVGEKVIRELCRLNLPSDLFPALKVLKVKDLHNYERVEVDETSLIEIFSNEENQGISSNMIQPLFDNLEFVEVENCSRLKTLVISSSFSFQSLKQLIIYKCHRLENLFGFSVAKTLVCLKKVKLCECNNVSTILARRKDEREEDEIVFSELEDLKLYDLPNLEMFQSAEWRIRFPNLKTIEIRKCPKMMTFSLGVVCTPLLKFIIVRKINPWREPKKLWVGSINDTIWQLFKGDEEDFGDSISDLFEEEEPKEILDLKSM